MLLKYKIHCNTENVDKFWYLPSTSSAPTKCPDDSAHSVQLSSVAMIGSTIPQPNPKTEDDRDILAVNRIPPGYTIYPTGRGDDITNGVYGAGPKLKLGSGTNEVEFQMKDHFYAVGGRVIWQGGTIDDEAEALLYAPATTGANEAGDYIKYNLAPGMNVFIPVAPGQGNWNLNLSEKLNNKVSILKCTPVPVEGNTGWFDYNSTTNTLTKNMSQKGGYNLYDFNAPLFKFGNCVYGQDKAEMALEASDVVGKLLYNSWKIKFTLTPAQGSTARAGVVMMLAVKRNT